MSPSDSAFHFIQVIGSIPRGRVATYGQIARLAGFPGHARQVGMTLRKLPRDSTLPWFRVLNAQGRISLPVGSKAYLRQKALLEDEGVLVEDDKVYLREYGWNP